MPVRRPSGVLIGQLIDARPVLPVCVENEEQLLYDGLCRRIDDEHAVQPGVHLPLGIEVRVVPERARVTEREPVLEPLARRDGRLHPGCAVHLPWHLDAVPVDGRRLVQLVVEYDRQGVTDLRPDDRARRDTIVSVPAIRLPSRDQLDANLIRGRIEVLRDREVGERRTPGAQLGWRRPRAAEETDHPDPAAHRRTCVITTSGTSNGASVLIHAG